MTNLHGDLPMTSSYRAYGLPKTVKSPHACAFVAIEYTRSKTASYPAR
jgi:hypothetical protein